MKLKKCQNESCGKKFEPRQIGQRACSTACALLYVHSHPELLERIGKRSAALQRAKARKERREGRAKLKTRSDWLKDCQKVFNQWVRKRDEGRPCISCGISSDCKINAGHYRTTASAPELRFESDNCHLQCEKCNTYLSGNIGAYRINLIKKIGLDRVEWLEGPHEPVKYTIDQIKDLIQVYKAKLKELQA